MAFNFLKIFSCLTHTLSLIIINSLLIQAQLSSRDTVSIQTTGGSIIIGKRETIDRSQRTYFSFKGLEYAEKPIGELRWKDPILSEIKSGTTIKALDYKSPCPQWNSVMERSIGEEDCLGINIFSPNIPGVSRDNEQSRSLLPVLVYIHGGGFIKGSGDQIGPKRFLKHDVVLVTFNYRLGIFGFLSTGDSIIPGNYGLLDQATALQWVKKFIRFFGGNPDRVTIFGQSAGAASVNLLMLSPYYLDQVSERELFQRAIIQSGSALCDWSINPNPSIFAKKISDEVGCFGGQDAVFDCLHEKTTSNLITTQQSFVEFWTLPLELAPVVDGEFRDSPFLPMDPKEAMEIGGVSQVQVMTGSVNEEGLLATAELLLKIGNESLDNEEFFKMNLIPYILKLTLNEYASVDENDIDERVTKSVFDQYFLGLDFKNDQKLVLQKLNDLMGDLLFNSCHQEMLEKLEKSSIRETYNYVFTHKTARSPSFVSNEVRKLAKIGIYHEMFNNGVSHADELFYLFEPLPVPGFNNEKLSPADEKISDVMVRSWVAFATDGAPNIDNFPKYPHWSPIESNNINYYNISSVPTPMRKDFRKGESQFWTKTLPYIEELSETISELEPYQILTFTFLGLFILFLIISIILGIILYRKSRMNELNNGNGRNLLA